MKIKTITCHKVYNHGASLQEYALLKYLNNIGHEAKTIDYTPHYLSGHFNLFAISNPKFGKNVIIKILYLLAKLPQRLPLLKRKKAFDIFEEKYIPSTSCNYKTNEELKQESQKNICTHLPNERDRKLICIHRQSERSGAVYKRTKDGFSAINKYKPSGN